MSSVVRFYQEVMDGIKKWGRNNPVTVSEIGTVEAGPVRYSIYKIQIKGLSGEHPQALPVFISAGTHGDEPGGVWATASSSVTKSTSLPLGDNSMRSGVCTSTWTVDSK